MGKQDKGRLLKEWFAGKLHFRAVAVDGLEMRDRIFLGYLCYRSRKGEGASLGEVSRSTGLSRTRACVEARDRLEGLGMIDFRLSDRRYYAVEPATVADAAVPEAEHWADRLPYTTYYPTHQGSGLTVGETYLYWTLWRQAEAKAGRVLAERMTWARLAGLTGIHRLTVSTNLRKMQRLGLVKFWRYEGQREAFAVELLEPMTTILEWFVDAAMPGKNLGRLVDDEGSFFEDFLGVKAGLDEERPSDRIECVSAIKQSQQQTTGASEGSHARQRDRDPLPPGQRPIQGISSIGSWGTEELHGFFGAGTEQLAEYRRLSNRVPDDEALRERARSIGGPRLAKAWLRQYLDRVDYEQRQRQKEVSNVFDIDYNLTDEGYACLHMDKCGFTEKQKDALLPYALRLVHGVEQFVIILHNCHAQWRKELQESTYKGRRSKNCAALFKVWLEDAINPRARPEPKPKSEPSKRERDLAEVQALLDACDPEKVAAKERAAARGFVDRMKLNEAKRNVAEVDKLLAMLDRDSASKGFGVSGTL